MGARVTTSQLQRNRAKAMIKGLKIAALCLGLLCPGCTSAVDRATKGVTGADPLDPNLNAGATPRQYLLAEITDSYGKCEAYKRRLLYGSRVSNLGFDILTTIFSALGSVFTPVETVHAFTAATTISSGTKTAIDADIYQNATAPLMVQAIATTYDQPMDDLHQQILRADENATNYDYGSVLRVHNRCSLTEALVSVQTLEDARTPPKPQADAANPADTPKATSQGTAHATSAAGQAKSAP
jgi:hypothetical protein